MKPPDPALPALDRLLKIMAALRSPEGCPWDREQNHHSLRFHAVEEVYELMDAIEANDEPAMIEELGDVLLQVVFHCQLGKEREAFDFERVCLAIVDKLIRRHPHVFGEVRLESTEQVLRQWEEIKNAGPGGEKRTSVFDGIPRRLPALQYADELIKRARKNPDFAPLDDPETSPAENLGKELFALTQAARQQGTSAEDLLRQENQRQERAWRLAEKRRRRA